MQPHVWQIFSDRESTEEGKTVRSDFPFFFDRRRDHSSTITRMRRGCSGCFPENASTRPEFLDHAR